MCHLGKADSSFYTASLLTKDYCIDTVAGISAYFNACAVSETVVVCLFEYLDQTG